MGRMERKRERERERERERTQKLEDRIIVLIPWKKCGLRCLQPFLKEWLLL